METLIACPEVSAPAHAPAPTSVYIVDDHPLFRDGLARCMHGEPDLRVAGQAGSIKKALADLSALPCEVVTLDRALDGENGMDFLRRVRDVCPRARVLVISMHQETQYALAALRAGALGYVTKYEQPEVLLKAIHAVASGQIYVSECFSSQLIYRVVSTRDPVENPLNVISARERDVLHFVGQGYSSLRIAEKLSLSVKTVEAHRLHIKEKLGLSNAAALVRFAQEWVKYDDRQPSAATAAAAA